MGWFGAVSQRKDSRIGPSVNWLTANPARAVVFAVLLAYSLAAVVAVSTQWYFEDADAYWQAALRLREGQPLYVAGSAGDPTVYRYAPWFAWAWVPLTYLPEGAVMALWGAVLAAAALWLLIPARTPAAVALAMLCFPDLLRVTSTGNVQPLLLAVCAYGVTSRMGPLFIGAAASLKGYPILLSAIWWQHPQKLAAAIAVAFLLIVPALAYDLSAYPLERALWVPGTLSVFLVVAKLLR